MVKDINRVIDGRAEYDRMLLKVEELKTMAEKMTPVLSDMPKGGNHTLEDTWIKLADYKSELQFKMSAYIQDCMELENELECIRNDNIRTAMKYKYIDGLTIEKIADIMIYDTRQIDRYLHTGRSIYERFYNNIY